MTTRGTINLKGLEEYLENIAQAGENVDEAAARAVDAGAEVVLESMHRLVPKDTGNLDEHLMKTDPQQDGNFIFSEVGMPKGKANLDADTARYGNVQEYGSARTHAQPYIRPSFDKTKSAVRKAERESLKGDGVI